MLIYSLAPNSAILGSMKKQIWILPLVIASGIFYFSSQNQSGAVTGGLANLATPKGLAAQKSCVGKGKCLVAVVAPWCGYCRRSSPMIKAMLEKLKGPELSFNAVVTGDENAAMEAYASELGAGAYYDPGNGFATAAGVKGFPTWVLFDPAAKTNRAVSGAFTSPEQLFAQLGITQKW